MRGVSVFRGAAVLMVVVYLASLRRSSLWILLTLTHDPSIVLMGGTKSVVLPMTDGPRGSNVDSSMSAEGRSFLDQDREQFARAGRLSL